MMVTHPILGLRHNLPRGKVELEILDIMDILDIVAVTPCHDLYRWWCFGVLEFIPGPLSLESMLENFALVR
jgi:hypothetical protein